MEINHIKEITIESVEQLFNGFTLYGEYSSLITKCIFRGESSNKYVLLPSILRNEKIKKVLNDRFNGSEKYIERNLVTAEYRIFSDFYRIANKGGLYVPESCRLNEFLTDNFDYGDANYMYTDEKWIPPVLYEIVGLIQHYGLPTRFLDWSSLWKIALYFAAINSVRNTKDDSTHFVLWALNIDRINGHRFNNEEFPLKIIRPVYNNNENLKAQKGLFTLWEIDKPHLNKYSKTKSELEKSLNDFERPINDKPLDVLLNERINYEYEKYNLDWPYEPILYKFMIPKELNKEVLRILCYEGINGSSIFPGYTGVQKAVEELAMTGDISRL